MKQYILCGTPGAAFTVLANLLVWSELGVSTNGLGAIV